MKEIFLKIIILTVGLNANCQSLVPFYKYSTHTDVKAGYKTDVKNLHLEKGNLYLNDTLFFDASGDFYFSIYEMLGDKYLVVTAIDKSQKDNAIIYMLPKNKIKVYDLEMGKWYSLDLKGKFIHSIIRNGNAIAILISECVEEIVAAIPDK